MDDYMPQDEYFEWEDIELYRSPFEVTETRNEECQQSQPLDFRSTFTHAGLFEDSESSSDNDDFQWSEAEISASTTISIQTSFTFESFQEEPPIDFPSYEGVECDPSIEGIETGLGGIETAAPIVENHNAPDAPATLQSAAIKINTRFNPIERATVTETRDCESLDVQPFGNVNYLLHQWQEEEVSASWKHVVSKRKTWTEDVSSLDHSSWKRHNVVKRLENVSWRSWSKLRFGLRTVSPTTINWLKHCDDTCLYGPLSVSRTSSISSSPQLTSSSPSRDSRSPNSKSDYRTTTPKSILKKPSRAELLSRGSLPTFSISYSSPITSIQGRPLSDNSPLTHLQLSHQHLEFRTPKPSSLCKSQRSVKFLSEVRQYTIVLPIGDRKIQRTIKKTRSTTLPEDNAQSKLIEPAKIQQVSEPSYWSPESLWSQNHNQEKSEKNDDQWTWLGVIGEEAVENDYFSSTHLSNSTTAIGTPYPQNSSPSIGEGSLSYYYGNKSCHFQNQSSIDSSDSSSIPVFKTDITVEDPIDYLLSCTSDLDSDLGLGAGSLSPPTSSTSDEDGADELSEESSDDESSGIASPPASRKDEKICGGERVGGLRVGLGVRGGMDIGIVGDEKHRLYEQVMEEFNLEY
ncbi:hypothetical protein VTL71DRAFT_9610 [Oculimacula yallundae]|uniref:Nitrogen regulatory protein areA GATA-like domain-containing protein n=1 Tax=Oculimacula yallundae TaxID=86028 RepID=A0ABR4BRC7_9HELO